MTDESKRKLVKALATGSGVVAVADQWARPVVSSVVLPSHGEATGEPEVPVDQQFCDTPDYLPPTYGPGPVPLPDAVDSPTMAELPPAQSTSGSEDANPLALLLEEVVPSAEAGCIPIMHDWHVCIEPTGVNTYRASVRDAGPAFDATWDGEGTVNSPTHLSRSGLCGDNLLLFTVTSMVVGVGADYELGGGRAMFTALPCSCTPEEADCDLANATTQLISS